MKKLSLNLVFFLLAAGIGVGWGDAGTAPSVMVMTLPDALKIAGERNVSMILADERVNQSVARIGEQRSGLLPSLNAVTSQSRQTRELSTVGINSAGGIVGPFDVFDARLKITQTIFDGKTIEGWKSAKVSFKLSRAQQEETRQDVLALTAVLFIDAKRASDRVGLMEVLMASDEKNLLIAQQQRELGAGSELNLNEAQAAFAQSAALLQTAKTQAEESRLDFLTALGLPSEQQISLQWGADLQRFTRVEGEDEAASVEEHPRVSVARQALAVSSMNQKSEQAGYLPKFSLVGDYGLSADLPQNSLPTYFFGVQATWPIFEGGLTQARVKETASQVRADQARLEDARREVKSAISADQIIIEQAQSNLDQRQAEWVSAQRNADLARLRNELGSGSEQEFLSAQARLAVSEDKKEEAIATLLTARINLVHAQGNIDRIFARP